MKHVLEAATGRRGTVLQVTYLTLLAQINKVLVGPGGSWWVAESSSLTATESAAIRHRLLLAVRIVPVRDTHTPTMTSVKAGLCYISKMISMTQSKSFVF